MSRNRAGLDALLAILIKHEIEQITHRVKPDRAPVIDNNPLKSHCAQYILAVAVVNHKIVPDDILQDRRDNPQIRMVYERVKLIGDREMDRWPAWAPAVVEVVLRDGRRFSERVDWAKGRRENPMTRAELEHKFLDLATTRISRDRANRLMDLVDHLETVPNVREIAELLRA